MEGLDPSDSEEAILWAWDGSGSILDKSQSVSKSLVLHYDGTEYDI